MNSKLPVLIFLCMFLIVGGISEGSALSYQQFVDFSDRTAIDKFNNIKTSYIDYGWNESWDNTTLYGSVGAWRVKDSKSTLTRCGASSNPPVGNFCGEWFYNISTGGAWIENNSSKYATIGFGYQNISNYSGIELWINSTIDNDAYLTFRLKSGNKSDTNPTYSAQSSSLNFSLKFTGWKKVYIDFLGFDNTNMNYDFLSNVSAIRLEIVSNGSNDGKQYVLKMDEIKFVDYRRSTMLTEQRYNLVNATPTYFRTQESYPLLIYLYYNNLSTLFNNESIQNQTYNNLNMLIETAIEHTGDWYNSKLNPAGRNFISVGATGDSFLQIYKLLLQNNDSMLYNNVTLLGINNTLKDHYNKTLQKLGNYYPNKIIIPNQGNYVSNQYLALAITNYVAYNISGNISYYDNFDELLQSVYDNQTIFGVLPEYTNETLKIHATGYDSSYTTGQISLLCQLYYESNDNRIIEIFRKMESLIFNNILADGLQVGINDSREDGPTYIMDHNILPACQKIFYDNNLTNFSQANYLAYIYFENDLLTGQYPYYAWNTAFKYSLEEDNFMIPINLSFKFPGQYNYFSYSLFNKTNYFKRNVININSSSFIKNLDEMPIMLFAYDSNNSWWVRGDYITTNQTEFIYTDENGNFTIPVIPKYKIIEGDSNVQILTQDNSFILNTTRSDNQIWFSTSSSTEKHIASNLSDTINDVTVIINVDSCDNVGKITYRSNTGTYSATYNRNDYTCSNNQVTLTIDGIEPSLNSNELNIEYGCSSTTRSGYMLVMIFASLIIFWFMGNFAWQSYQEGNLTVGKLIMVFVIIVVCLALWTASGQNLGSSCGVVG